MKSKRSATNNITWDSSLLDLSPASSSKKPKNLQKLHENGLLKVKDLLKILPLRNQPIPKSSPFYNLEIGKFFQGEGHVIARNIQPVFKRMPGKPLLHNITITVQDRYSEGFITLTWFNCYPNQKKEIESLEFVKFMGSVKGYKEQFQIISPKLSHTDEEFFIEYPTVFGVSGTHLKSIMNKIPEHLWEENLQVKDEFDIYLKLGKDPLTEVFKALHGKSKAMTYEEAKNELIYHEFFSNELKISARKNLNGQREGFSFEISDTELNDLLSSFPYQLTPDQDKSLIEIRNDLQSKKASSRILQGDVGCGKTSIAILAGLITNKNGHQVALMCPTEALARQHYSTLLELFPETRTGLILGSQSQKVKKEMTTRLLSGDIEFVIGTHSLIQESIHFKNLGLAIIDEQHKFGVKQRMVLESKNPKVNVLLMSATPIPRTLQLAQYGDLDISTIMTMPKGRKGTQTRIVEQNNFGNFLNFVKTRLSLKEQVYIVAPAIEESEAMELENINNIHEFYKKNFSTESIGILHGRLSAEEKEDVLQRFYSGKISILITTTVIEVGINNINATVMAVYGPERFGLSSLHQLRGRVGRGDKPGFFFLVAKSQISEDSMRRLKVIEQNDNGFQIAEADLKIRGQGDLFGSDQSGHVSRFTYGNIIEHFSIYQKAHNELEELKKQNPTLLSYLEEEIAQYDQKVLSTI